MEGLAEFAITVILISSSGVLTPGPLFFANVSLSVKGEMKTGIKIALGHTFVELPLIVFLGLGLFSVEFFPEIRAVISISGGVLLFVFAIIQIRTIFQKSENRMTSKYSPTISGIMFTALNPFFIIWWITIGFKLISDAILIWAFGGIIVVFLLHIWMDFVWLGAVSYLSSKGSKIISNNSYKILTTILSLGLIYFGIVFIMDVV
jgi:threonine/homoserine/homoserine lactone efflux protein